MRTIGRQCQKRRLRVFYVRVGGQLFAVWAHNRLRAEQLAMDAVCD